MGVAGCPLVDPALAGRGDLAVGFDEMKLVQVDAFGQVRPQERFG